MTEGLKELLQHYGILSVALWHLTDERPGSDFDSLQEYYRQLGGFMPDEPVLVVRISKDGEAHFLKDGEHDVECEDESGTKSGSVSVMELPEDEWWYFRAFRPGLFDLDKELPRFIYELAIVSAYSEFEGYLSNLLRMRLRRSPQLMGAERGLKYEQVFAASSMDELIYGMVKREVRDLLYLPFLGLLKKMRVQLGFRSLADQYDDAANYVSLLRNCLLHNHGLADAKLARARPSLRIHDRLSLGMADVNEAVRVLRKLAYEIDKTFEREDSPST